MFQARFKSVFTIYFDSSLLRIDFRYYRKQNPSERERELSGDVNWLVCNFGGGGGLRAPHVGLTIDVLKLTPEERSVS